MGEDSKLGIPKEDEKPVVLIVDDSEDIRVIFSFFIEQAGCVPQTASNGREALHWLRNHPKPRLILLDLMMPVMDGWQTEQELAKDPELSYIPTVIVTAFPEKMDRLERSLEVVQKPGDIPKLKELVTKYCFHGSSPSDRSLHA